jgi:hypothetical protein
MTHGGDISKSDAIKALIHTERYNKVVKSFITENIDSFIGKFCGPSSTLYSVAFDGSNVTVAHRDVFEHIVFQNYHCDVILEWIDAQ